MAAALFSGRGRKNLTSFFEPIRVLAKVVPGRILDELVQRAPGSRKVCGETPKLTMEEIIILRGDTDMFSADPMVGEAGWLEKRRNRRAAEGPGREGRGGRATQGGVPMGVHTIWAFLLRAITEVHVSFRARVNVS